MPGIDYYNNRNVKLKAIVFLLIIIAFSAVNLPLPLSCCLNTDDNLFAEENVLSGKSPDYEYKEQSNTIKLILDNEKNIEDLKKIINLLKYIDDVYVNLYSRLKRGQKIIIFFDPAHGRLENGKWEGEVTGRISYRGLPEEYYSIQFSRKLYRLLKRNKFIDVKSTEDYSRVLRDESGEYRNIPFSETVKFAMQENAFIIISEHLNNIAGIKKADGIVNLSGIHVTVDDIGNRYLKYVDGVYKGFLTLYNKYDASGFSKRIANRTKEILGANGVNLNNWDYGAVADDRFSYFVDFPVSVIFENGFISSPDEEKLVMDPEYQEIIVQAQYKALLETFEEKFRVDISGFWPRRTGDASDSMDLIKLSRIAIYYLQNDNPDKAVRTIGFIESKYKKSHAELISHFTEIKRKIIDAEKNYYAGIKYLKRNRYSIAKKYIGKAIRYVDDEPVYSSVKARFAGTAYKYFKTKFEKKTDNEVSRIRIPDRPERSQLTRPVILAIEENRSLEQSVMDALQPDPGTLSRLMASFENPRVWEKVLAKKYSKEQKRTIRYWKWKRIKVDFKEGIYLIKLNSEMKVVSVKRTSQVLLDPRKYQNQQYLKNSYFAVRTKEKTL